MIRKKAIDILFNGIASGIAKTISIILVDLTIEAISEKRREKSNAKRV